MRSRVRRLLTRPSRTAAPAAPVLSFGSWGALEPGAAVAFCHPEWRGVRAATYSWRAPTVECADLGAWSTSLIEDLRRAEATAVVVSGFPPGSPEFLRSADAAGFATRVVLHSSMAQHGAEAGEAEIAEEVLALADEGVVGRVGFAKEGLQEAFAALGFDVAYVPNRVPQLPDAPPLDLGPGLHIGVFAEPFWRKNVVTQLGAVALLDGATGHVMIEPDVSYLRVLPVVAHGSLPWQEFIRVQSGVDLNLYVTLSECQPLTPLESYGAEVPCLMSRTSALFRDDRTLWDLTSVGEADNPRAIAVAAERLLSYRDEAVRRAAAWMEEFDEAAAERWDAFTTL